MQLFAKVPPNQTQWLQKTTSPSSTGAFSKGFFLQRVTASGCLRSSSPSNNLVARTTSGSTSVLPVPRLIQYYNEVGCLLPVNTRTWAPDVYCEQVAMMYVLHNEASGKVER
eukprot:scaffold76041_cov18-Tisochrysis_lutea.AAC.3